VRAGSAVNARAASARIAPRSIAGGRSSDASVGGAPVAIHSSQPPHREHHLRAIR
jgi:hypothetical protein